MLAPGVLSGESALYCYAEGTAKPADGDRWLSFKFISLIFLMPSHELEASTGDEKLHRSVQKHCVAAANPPHMSQSHVLLDVLQVMQQGEPHPGCQPPQAV